MTNKEKIKDTKEQTAINRRQQIREDMCGKHNLNRKKFGGKWSGYYSWYCLDCKKKFKDSVASKILHKSWRK